MKKFSLNILIFFLLFVSIINAQTTEDEVSRTNSISVFLSYEKVPNRVYVGEVFTITLKAITTSRNYDKITTTISDNNNFEVLNKNNAWIATENPKILNTTLYLKVKKKANYIPGFTIRLIENGEVVETANIGRIEVETIKLNTDEIFSGVLAQSFDVISYFTNRFDEDNVIFTATFEANTGNLNDFNISMAEKSRVDILSESNLDRQKIQYSGVLPNYKKTLEFTYFNTLKNNFELIKIPLILKSDDVSTHSDINPKENIFNLYKNIALCIFVFILIIIFAIKRYKIAIILAFLILIFLAYNNNPFNDVKLEQNTNVHILPNEKLTILHVTEQVTDAEKLDEKDDFIKVLLPNGKIGWVKKERVIKN